MPRLLHQPVMVREVLEGLVIQPNGVYVDGTFGRGGHAKAILASLGPEGKLFALDKDPSAIAAAYKDEAFKDERFILQQGSFAMLLNYLRSYEVVGKVAGIVLDLGVSSPQLDDPQRGFSFLHDGPLDMRMNPQTGMSAAAWVNAASVTEIARVIKEYGEERYALRIAKAIVAERVKQPIETTGRLAEIVKKAHPRWERHKHPATRVFQAIRIFINQELAELEVGLSQCVEALVIHGRLAVISFHSLEDRIVKRFIQGQPEESRRMPYGWQPAVPSRMRRIGKAIKPSSEEVAQNPRARSAILRIAEKQV